MVRQMRMTGVRSNHKKTIQVANKYAAYMARQESIEIDNALFTLNRIHNATQPKNKTKVIVRTAIVHPND